MYERPHFIIVGVMKGGTTALYDFISLHPDVDKAKEKEIHFFSLHYQKGADWYLEHFPEKSNKMTGEASPTYFDVANTVLIPNLIKSFNPNVKLLLIVRDPIERAVSQYHHFCKIMKIPEVSDLDINEFFNLPIKKAFTETNTIGFYLHQALSFSLYYRKFLYYQSVFDKNNLLVLHNKQLRENPSETMRMVYSFLDVQPMEFEEFKQIRYSLGTNTSILSRKTFERLAELFYPDYKKFCQKAGIPYEELTLTQNISPRKKQTNNSSITTATNDTNLSAPSESDEDEDVHIGLNGWLFLRKGSNNAIDYYLDPDLFSEEKIHQWINLLGERINFFRSKNIRYLHLFVPNKLSIYPEYFDGGLPHFASSPLRKLHRRLVELGEEEILAYIVNPISFFEKLKQTHQLFWKTDTHWTFFGVFGAYQLICARLGTKANVELLQRGKVSGKLVMDEGGKLNPPIAEEATFYQLLKDAKRIYANPIVEYKEKNKLEGEIGLHVGSNVVFRNKYSLNDEKVVLFGDSFSEYRPHLLTGALAETFRELHFVWSVSLDYKYIEKVKPDIVLTEIVERFMPQVPTDRFDLEKYCKDKLKEKPNRIHKWFKQRKH